MQNKNSQKKINWHNLFKYIGLLLISSIAFFTLKSLFQNDRSRIVSSRGQKILSEEGEKSVDEIIKERKLVY